MKRFLIRFFSVFVGFYAMLYAMGYAYDYSIKYSDDVDHSLWREVATGEINADIVFIGSSRALVHYDPRIFEQKLGYSAFVLGLNSGGYDIQKVLRDLYLDNNTPPKILVQNVDVTSFNRTSRYYKPPYLPYLSYKNLFPMMEVNDQAFFEWALPMYKYRYYVQNYDKLYQSGDIQRYKGYQERDQTWEDFLEHAPIVPNKAKVDISTFDYEKGLAHLTKVANQAKDLNTELYLVWAPEYYERFSIEEPHLSDLLVRFRKIEQQYKHVHFLDFTKDSLTLDKTYFYNDFHLNKKGVKIYNDQLIDSIIMYQNLK